MIRTPPYSTLTYTLFPSTTLFRSCRPASVPPRHGRPAAIDRGRRDRLGRGRLCPHPRRSEPRPALHCARFRRSRTGPPDRGWAGPAAAARRLFEHRRGRWGRGRWSRMRMIRRILLFLALVALPLQSAVAAGGRVSSGEPRAAEAGREILKEGGSAADAAKDGRAAGREMGGT